MQTLNEKSKHVICLELKRKYYH